MVVTSSCPDEDDHGEPQLAAGTQHGGEDRPRVGDECHRTRGQLFTLDVADRPDAGGDVHESHAPAATQGHSSRPGQVGHPLTDGGRPRIPGVDQAAVDDG